MKLGFKRMSNYRASNRVYALLAATSLAGCVSPPVHTVSVTAVPRPVPRAYAYPVRGQSADQIERDRYDCYVESVRQTGVDPTRVERSYQQAVVAPAPGLATATGAIGGAVLGSLFAGPRSAGLGLLLGGTTGAMVGSAADADAQAQASLAQNRIYSAEIADAERAREYQNANSACLVARGYSVR